MAENKEFDNSLDEISIDSITLDDGSGYVPKFERDLAKAGGNLETLSASKKELKSENNSDLISTDSIDSNEYKELKSVSDNTNYNNENEFVSLPEESLENTSSNNNSYIDPEELPPEEKLKALNESVDASSIQLSDMDYDAGKSQTNALKKQMQLDDMAMELGSKPIIDDMSDKYAPLKQKSKEELLSKDKLDNDEKRLMRERLESEIGRRPEGYSKKKSLEMYHKLMDEQKVKKAKKGLGRVLFTIILGVITSAITYFMFYKNIDIFNISAVKSEPQSELFLYLSLATLCFSLLLLIKLKVIKVFSCIYFALNTVALIGPGFIKFAMQTGASLDKNWIVMFAAYVIAVAFSVNNCIQLSANEYIEAYYSTALLHDEKKEFDDRKTKYSQ